MKALAKVLSRRSWRGESRLLESDCCVADESGCEADMAEGGQDEDSGDVMLAGAAAATTTASTAPKRDQETAQQPIALNIKSEVSFYHKKSPIW